jgi:hypothetical protein
MSVPAEVESLIAGAPVSAHLGTTVNDRSHVAPVWYGYRDGILYFMTGGKKLENVRRNPQVAVSIEEARGGDVEWNVTLLGRATVSDDPDRIDWASGWIYDKYDDEEVAGDDGTDDDAVDSDDDTQSDGGESDEDGEDYALVEVTIGSASWNVYE